MSFSTQRFGNSFPVWSKVRHDPSSEGQRLFSSFAELIEDQDQLNFDIMTSANVLSKRMGKGVVWTINLEEADFITKNQTSPVRVNYVYPSLVEGTYGSVTEPIERAGTVQELLYAPPKALREAETIDVSPPVVWDSITDVYNSVGERPERLIVEVTDSEEFYRVTRTRNLNKTGRLQVLIEGEDENCIPIEESLFIPDDGTFWTNNIFSKVTKVTYEGFNGNVTVRSLAIQNLYEQHPSKILVDIDLEGPLRMKLMREGNASFLSLFTPRLKTGLDYRKAGLTPIDNDEEILRYRLFDETGTDIELIDIAFSYEDFHVYGLDENGDVHYWKLELPFFTPYESIETDMTWIEIRPIHHWVPAGATDKLGTYFVRRRAPIQTVEIKRISPSGIVNWLQPNRTWDTPFYSFSGNPNQTTDRSWQDFLFDSEYTEVGEYEFVCTVMSEGEETVYVTKVMSLALEADKTFSLGVADPQGLYFSQTSELAIVKNTEITFYKPYHLVYYAEEEEQQLIFIDEFDSIEVTV